MFAIHSHIDGVLAIIESHPDGDGDMDHGHDIMVMVMDSENVSGCQAGADSYCFTHTISALYTYFSLMPFFLLQRNRRHLPSVAVSTR